MSRISKFTEIKSRVAIARNWREEGKKEIESNYETLGGTNFSRDKETHLNYTAVIGA